MYSCGAFDDKDELSTFRGQNLKGQKTKSQVITRPNILNRLMSHTHRQPAVVDFCLDGFKSSSRCDVSRRGLAYCSRV